MGIVVCNLNFRLRFLCLAVFLTSCSDKVPLKGERHSLFSKQVERSETKETIRIPGARNLLQMTEGFPDGTNLMPCVEFSDNLKWRTVWQNGVAAESELTNSGDLVVVNNRIYFTDSYGTVYCANKQNGLVVWKVNTSPDGKMANVSTYISYRSGKLFVTTSYASFFVFDAATGNRLYAKEYHAPAKTAVRFFDGLALLVRSDSVVDALNENTLNQVWKHSVPSDENGLIGLASVAYSHGKIVVPYKNGEVCALDASTGEQVWNRTISTLSITESVAAMAHIKASPVIYNGKVYVLSNCGKVECLSLEDGRAIWSSNAGGGIWTPVVIGNVLYFVSNDNTLIALSNVTGNKFWVLTLPTYKGNTEYVWYGPVLTSSGVLVANSIGDVIFVDPVSGKVKHTMRTKMKICATPKVIDKTIYFITSNGLFAFR